MQEFDEGVTGERGVVGGFDHNRAASGDGGGDLVHDQIEWMIEGTDSHYDADGLFASEGQSLA